MWNNSELSYPFYKKTSEETEARQRENIKNYWKGGRINDI